MTTVKKPAPKAQTTKQPEANASTKPAAKPGKKK